MYVSEFTKFINGLKDADPTIDASQKRGRAVWWDKKPATAEEREQTAASRVRQSGYVYQTKL